MVYIKHWAEFQTQALDLYKRHPNRTRYLIKAHPGRQWLVLKVTDDYTTLKFRSRSTVILNRFEAFNKEILGLMHGVESTSSLPAAVADVASTAASTVQQAASAAVTAATTTNTSTEGTSGGGSGNKKKKKKGKK